MATNHTERQSCGVPLKYRCSKCGAENVSVIAIHESASKSIPDLTTKSRKNEMIRDLKWRANARLTSELKKLYEKDPLESGMEIRGKCSKCGNVEPWQTSKAASAGYRVFGTLGAFAIFGLGCILAVVWDSGIPIIAVPVIAMAAIYLYSQMPWVKKSNEAHKAKMMAIAPENRPAYVVPLEELVEAVNAKYKESLEEMED